MSIHTSARKGYDHDSAVTSALSLSVHKRAQFYLMSGGLYLNQSCKHLQEGRQYAWAGTIEQARNARRDYPAAAGCRTVDIRSIVPTPMKDEA